MAIRLMSLVNYAQTIDEKVLPPHATQIRSGTKVTDDMADAILMRRAQASVMVTEALSRVSED